MAGISYFLRKACQYDSTVYGQWAFLAMVCCYVFWQLRERWCTSLYNSLFPVHCRMADMRELAGYSPTELLVS